MKYKSKIKLKRKYSPHYTDKKPFFSEKEIIFRSSGKAMVFKFSSKTQFLILLFVLLISFWSFYSYHMYNKSGKIILGKDIELLQTRDAYEDLMSDFVVIQKNIDEVLTSMDKTKSQKVAEYKRQAMEVEGRLKQIANDKNITDNKRLMIEPILTNLFYRETWQLPSVML